jgi:hypothetical protein
VRYALLAYGGTAADVELEAELAAAGALVSCEALTPADLASTVRVRDSTTVTDGPATDDGDALLGVLVVDVSDLDVALAVARRCPAARSGCIEVRPVA